MWKEFRDFAVKGNILDLAIGVIIGGAFGKVTTSLVNDILMPPIGMIVGRVDFSNLYIPLNGQHYDSLAAAKVAGAPTLNIGLFVNNLLDFTIMAFAVFLVVRQVNALRKRWDRKEKAPSMKECPYCLTKVPVKATRCSACTSQLTSEVAAHA
ncbi:MAG TPA: large conductance mechanosensitive channel protein MscL [Symbiobacteriaceae bacterium]|nr:large conductance mechanosensitive channel protein MscL [Symbiobacteriaceae bacterium]